MNTDSTAIQAPLIQMGDPIEPAPVYTNKTMALLHQQFPDSDSAEMPDSALDDGIVLDQK